MKPSGACTPTTGLDLLIVMTNSHFSCRGLPALLSSITLWSTVFVILSI